MTKENIRIARPEDTRAMVEVNDQSWLETYVDETLGITKEMILQKTQPDVRNERVSNCQRQLKNKESSAWVAEVDGKIVGYIWPRMKEGKHRLGALYILKAHTGKGLGSKLLKKALDLYKGHDIYLECAIHNTNAEQFYKKHGFEYTGDPIHDVEVISVKVPVRWMVRKKVINE